MNTPKRKIRKNYVNNADFLVAIVQYKKEFKEASDKGLPRPTISNYIGECIFQIATNLAKKPNFYSYSFKEDMIMDGVENCILYIHNFDENKTQNPFAYVTQIIYYAFLRKIAKEKKQMYIKFKSSQKLLMSNETFDGDDEMSMYLNTGADYINSFIEDYELKMANDKKKNIND